jgi:chymotrypsin-like protease
VGTLHPKMKLSTAVFLCSCAALLEGSTIRKPRIVNGEEANPGQFPWEVGVVRVKSSLLYYCAGAIIGEEWILTSAYCVDQAESLMVIYGTNDLEDTDASFSLTKNYFIHDGFDSSALRSNIALVRLNESLTFNDKVQAIALSDEELGAGVEVTVSGWGHTSDGTTSQENNFSITKF